MTYLIRRDPLNGNRWQPKVRQCPDGGAPMWFDAGDAYDTLAEAEAAVKRMVEAALRPTPRQSSDRHEGPRGSGDVA